MQAPPGPIREARRGCGQALVGQWIDFTTTELDAPLLSWILPNIGLGLRLGRVIGGL